MTGLFLITFRLLQEEKHFSPIGLQNTLFKRMMATRRIAVLILSLGEAHLNLQGSDQQDDSGSS
jgi:hypothetical protein